MSALLRSSICRELPASAEAPEWVELLPAGPRIEGRDGRAWTLTDPSLVVARFRGRLVFDWEHGTQLVGPKGARAPAAAWIEALEVREGAIWGRVDWTPAGAQDVKSRAYRFQSPVFTHTAAGEIIQLVGAGLTNSPNLDLVALNRADDKDSLMNYKAIAKALGLAETATEPEILTALNSLQTSAGTPSLDKFVPRADYDVALNRASLAEKTLSEQATTALNQTIEQELTAACKAGKITPATMEYYRTSCRQEGGLERFRTFAKDAPVIGEPSKLDGQKPPTTGPSKAGALTDEERAVCRQMGLSETEFASFGKEK